MFVNAINMSLLWSEDQHTLDAARFSPSNVSRYNAPHLLSSPQHLQRLRFTGNSIVHTSWCEEV